MNQLRKRLTYANVMSSIAVFLLLGGATALAAKNVLPKNSVGTKQLKKNAVTSVKVKNHSLQASDFKAGQLPSGPPGAPGPVGPAGKDAFGELIYVVEGAENPNNTQSFVEAECPGGYHVTGGGVYGTEEEPGQNVNSSFPAGGEESEIGNTGWAGWVNNESGEDAFIFAFAICAKAGTVSGP